MDSGVALLTIFILSIFVGFEVVSKVSTVLHTPLMSVTNAISGIIVVGALLQVPSDNPAIKWVAFVAILLPIGWRIKETWEPAMTWFVLVAGTVVVLTRQV